MVKLTFPWSTSRAQYANDVVSTSVRRRINVINVVWTLKRRRVLTGRSWFLLGFKLRPQKIRFLHQIPLELTSCFFRYKKNKFCLWKKKPRKLKNIEFDENLKGVFFGYKKMLIYTKEKNTKYKNIILRQ